MGGHNELKNGFFDYSSHFDFNNYDDKRLWLTESVVEKWQCKRYRSLACSFSECLHVNNTNQTSIFVRHILFIIWFNMTKRKADFWDEFEAECSHTGLSSKVPDSMKRILTACGYDTKWAFKSADEDKIEELLADLETFIEKHHRNLVDSLEVYKDIQPFKFLPGHRSLILGIKAQIVSIEDVKKTKFMPKIPKQKANPIDADTDETGLKMSLITQISSYSSNLLLQIDWKNSIKQFNITTNEGLTSVQCLLVCPICGASRKTRFDKRWKISNMCKHLRSHIEEIQIEPTSENEDGTQQMNSNEATNNSNIEEITSNVGGGNDDNNAK